MNEKLKELCQKADIDIRDFKEVGFVGVSESELEKFAELIVLECAQCCDELQQWESTEPRHCAYDIKVTFGLST